MSAATHDQVTGMMSATHDQLTGIMPAAHDQLAGMTLAAQLTGLTFVGCCVLCYLLSLDLNPPVFL